MADVRLGSGLPVPTGAGAGPTPAARAAQRAFFDAALTRAGAPAAVTRPLGGEAQAPARMPIRATPLNETPVPDRLLRPGSFLDIKV